MNQSLIQRLEQSLETSSASGRVIATYMLSNLQDLPFQTAASYKRAFGVVQFRPNGHTQSLIFVFSLAWKNKPPLSFIRCDPHSFIQSFIDHEEAIVGIEKQ